MPSFCLSVILSVADATLKDGGFEPVNFARIFPSRRFWIRFRQQDSALVGGFPCHCERSEATSSLAIGGPGPYLRGRDPYLPSLQGRGLR